MPPKPKKLSKKQIAEQEERERREKEAAFGEQQGRKEAEEVARVEAELLAKREQELAAKREAERLANNPTMQEMVNMNIDSHGTLWLNEKRLNRRRPDELQLLSTAIGASASRVEELTLYGNALDDLQFSELLPGLRKLRKLTELRLDCNKLSEVSCEAVTLATSFWPKLERVYFEDNRGMSGDSIADFFTAWQGPPAKQKGMLEPTSTPEITLDQLNSTRKSRMKRKILEDVTAELKKLYQKNNPKREKNIPKLLARYVGREQVLLQKVREKYAEKKTPRRMAWD
jgi:hypothetical protein